MLRMHTHAHSIAYALFATTNRYTMRKGLTAMASSSNGCKSTSTFPNASNSSHISNNSVKKAPCVLIISGPTCVGKSSTALNLARLLNGEIISADSVQVYRGLDVGSNKAHTRERLEVMHHLIDVADASSEEFSAGDFVRACKTAVESVRKRGKLPIITGGSMMYLRWFVRGPPSTPRPSHSVREEVQEMLKHIDDWHTALKLLAEIDETRAKELSENDWYRLQRALQVAKSANAPLSKLPQIGASPKCEDFLEYELAAANMYDLRCVFLYDDRLQLNRRIDERCELMIAGMNGEGEEGEGEGGKNLLETQSVVAEVGRLLANNALRVQDSSSPALAIGYRQTIRYLCIRALVHQHEKCDATESASDIDVHAQQSLTANKSTKKQGEEDDALREFRAYLLDFMQATRNYAKQQLAWFRKEPHFRWVRAGAGAEEVLQNIMKLTDIEYKKLNEVTKESQHEIKQDIIQQGKQMRTYLPRKLLLGENSIQEKRAVRLAEHVAKVLAERIEREELMRMLDIVKK